MKLTYWLAVIKTDAPCYCVRAKTRKECKRLLDERGSHNEYCKPHKVVAEYRDAFDLMDQISNEGGPCWEEDCDD